MALVLCPVGISQAQSLGLDLLPIFPINFDLAIRDQTFAPNDLEIGIQAGYTLARYQNWELRNGYQFFALKTTDFRTDQHALFLNPRLNNFIDVIDFSQGRWISRLIRHVLFGPLEDRAVPYVGALGGVVLSLPGDHVGPFYGGQVGVRFPVARGISVDFNVQYSRFQAIFEDEIQYAQQWVFLSGVRF